MGHFRFHVVALSLPLLSVTAQAQLCSTEKVNRDNCTVYISRRYPVTLPTIQMRPGRKVTIVVHEPLPFETLSLDLTAGTALPGTDQGSTLLTAVIPDLKGLFFSNVTLPQQPGGIGPQFGEQIDKSIFGPCSEANYDQKKCDEQKKEEDEQKKKAARDAIAKAKSDLPQDLETLWTTLNHAQENFETNPLYLHFPEHAAMAYAQLNQALSPIPKAGFDPNHTKPEYDYQPPFPDTPPIDPWTEYPRWRKMMLCELGGAPKDGEGGRDCQLEIPFQNRGPMFP